ncbi:MULTISPECIES: hypothetical protein [Kordiimonas]|jgi:hypothetical protein|uniref:hypothetical protein n=1 Tax=Kordiimonas TaxID=288021 RepID=UPI00257DF684|nr:hypothetical protein [Kordiimonas sp. UBA4487]
MKNKTEKNGHSLWGFCMVWLLVALSGSVFATDAPYTVEEIRERAGWQAVELDLEVDLTTAMPSYSGTIRLRLQKDQSLGPVLLLNNREAGMGDFRVWLKSAGADKLPDHQIENDIEHPGGRASSLSMITFEKPLEKGAEIEVQFTYHLARELGQIFHRTKSSYASWVTLWYPLAVEDSPALVSRPALSVPGMTRFQMPAGWNVLSNGRLYADETDGGKTLQSWRMDDPVARSYMAGPFTVSRVTVGEKEVAMYMLGASQEVVDANSKQLAQTIDVLQRYFGPYPFETFGVAEFPDETTDYFGAASEQGFIVAKSSYFESEGGWALFAHEAGHAWWGNKFGCRGQGASLCDEALAQLGPVLVAQEIYGEQAMRDLLDVSVPGFTVYASARGYFAMWRSGEDIALDSIGPEAGWRLTRLEDSKGMWFWHMLRQKLGDDVFFPVLQELANSGQFLELEQLETVFEQHSNMDLTAFFAQWLTRKGAPIIDMTWEVVNPMVAPDYMDGEYEAIIALAEDGEKEVRVDLVQRQDELYKLDVEVEIQYYHKPVERRVIQLNEKHAQLVFKTDGNVRNITVDPDRKILMWRPAYGPRPIFDGQIDK